VRGGTAASLELSRYFGRASWPQKEPAGRVCSHEGCETILSVYNRTGTCELHRPEPDMSYHGHTFRICPACGYVAEVRKRRPHRRCGECGERIEGGA